MGGQCPIRHIGLVAFRHLQGVKGGEKACSDHGVRGEVRSLLVCGDKQVPTSFGGNMSPIHSYADSGHKRHGCKKNRTPRSQTGKHHPHKKLFTQNY